MCRGQKVYHMKIQLMFGYFLPCFSMNPFICIYKLNLLFYEAIESFQSGKERTLSIKYKFPFPYLLSLLMMWLLNINNFCFATMSPGRLIMHVTPYEKI